MLQATISGNGRDLGSFLSCYVKERKVAKGKVKEERKRVRDVPPPLVFPSW